MMFGKVNVCQNSEKHVGNILHPFEHTAIQKSLFIDRYGTVRVLNSIHSINFISHSAQVVTEPITFHLIAKSMVLKTQVLAANPGKIIILEIEILKGYCCS